MLVACTTLEAAAVERHTQSLGVQQLRSRERSGNEQFCKCDNRQKIEQRGVLVLTNEISDEKNASFAADSFCHFPSEAEVPV